MIFHPEGNIDLWTKCYNLFTTFSQNPFVVKLEDNQSDEDACNSCRDISVWVKMVEQQADSVIMLFS